MRIAMIGQKGIPTRFGGIERHVEALATRLGARGHAVTVYTRSWYAVSNPNFAPGVRTVATFTLQTKHLDAIIHTFTSTLHAMRWGADIIHYHGVGPSLLSWIPRIFAPRIRVVSTFHCVDRNHQKWGWFARLSLGLGERAACGFPHKTIAVSKTLQAYCMHRFGTDVRYVPNGVDTAPRRIGTDKLAQFGLIKDGYIVMVARLVRHKGAHHLVDAYRDLKLRNLHRGKKLVIVGGSAFTDGYVDLLHHMAGGDSDIVFTGYLKGQLLEQVFNGAYAVVHPSESEGLPIAVLEAMRYGKTVLASDIPENMEVVREHGMSFRNRSIADLARKLSLLLEHPAAAKVMGSRAKKFVLAHYAWDDVAAETERLYAELLGIDAPVWTPAPAGAEPRVAVRKTVRAASPKAVPAASATAAKTKAKAKPRVTAMA